MLSVYILTQLLKDVCFFGVCSVSILVSVFVDGIYLCEVIRVGFCECDWMPVNVFLSSCQVKCLAASIYWVILGPKY